MCVPSKEGTYRWKVQATDGGGVAPVTDVIAQQIATFHYTPPPRSCRLLPGTLSVDQVTGHAASITGTAAYGVTQNRDACEAPLPATCVDLRQTPVLTWDPVPRRHRATG